MAAAIKKKIGKATVDALKPDAEAYVAWDTEISGFGVRAYPSARKVYILKYRVGGGRAGKVRWATVGTHGNITPDQARSIARQWAAEVAQGGDPASTRDEARKAPTMSELLDRYLADHVRVHNKPSTQVQVTDLVERLLRPRLGKLKVAAVSRAEVSQFHISLKATPTTANRAVSALSKAFSLAEVWGYRPDHSNPCYRLKRYKEVARDRYLSAEEFSALGAVLSRAEHETLTFRTKAGRTHRIRANPEAVRAIRLMIFTGMRTGEVRQLRWEHLNLSKGVANLPDSKSDKKVVQLPSPAIETIEMADRPKSGKGFVIRGGRSRDPETALVNIKDTWRAVRILAGIPDVRPHDLRHAFASVAANDGTSLLMIGSMLGHSEARTTLRYAHLANAPLKEVANKAALRIAEDMRRPMPKGREK